ncbi:hypothetical protein [Lacticaseibacillus saniviri]
MGLSADQYSNIATGNIVDLLGKSSSDIWQLMGSYNKVPMLPAPVVLKQDPKPAASFGSDNTIPLSSTALKAGPVTKSFQGIWQDPYANTKGPFDQLLLQDANGKTLASANIQTQVGTTTNSDGQTVPEGDVIFEFHDQSDGTAVKMSVSGTNATVILPLNLATVSQKYSLVLKSADVNVGTTTDTTPAARYHLSADNISSAQADFNIIIAQDIKPDNSLDNYFWYSDYANEQFTQQIIPSNGSVTFNVKGKFTNKSETADETNIMILFPKIAGIGPSMVQLVDAKGNFAGKAGTVVGNSPLPSTEGIMVVDANDDTNSKLGAGESVYYQTSYTLSAAQVAQLGDTTPFTTYAGTYTLSGTTITNFELWATANTINLVKQSSGVQLLGVPALDFGTHKLSQIDRTKDQQFQASGPVKFTLQYVDGKW